MVGIPQEDIKEIMDSIGNELKHFSLDDSPPEMAKKIQRLFVDKVGESDPYKALKDASNTAALSVYPDLVTIVKNSNKPLRTAVELACAGNIIDYGAFTKDLDVKAEIMSIVNKAEGTIAHENADIFAFDAFAQALQNARKLVYVGDNTGEIVFDRVLLETIAQMYPELEIFFATRGTPILNDCLVEDAYTCGLQHSATIISSGVSSPGLILSDASEEFRTLFSEADLIISKGQGNYEALSSVQAPIFFLLITKCSVIARDLNCKLRNLVLKRQSNG
jgi:damage-control phosphatase, subfamily I